MEISIDLEFLREICFGNEDLLREMVEEWCSDTREKMDSIQKMHELGSGNLLFNRLHELKTNFTMIRCSHAIQASEKMLSKLENGSLLEDADIVLLESLCSDLNKVVTDSLAKPNFGSLIT